MIELFLFLLPFMNAFGNKQLHYSQDSGEIPEAIVIKHEGMIDKPIYTLILSEQSPSPATIDLVKINNQYLPRYFNLICKKEALRKYSDFFDLNADIWKNDGSIYFGCISVTKVYTSGIVKKYIVNLKDSIRVMCLFSQEFKKYEIDESKYVPIDKFYCSLSGKSYPCKKCCTTRSRL